LNRLLSAATGLKSSHGSRPGFAETPSMPVPDNYATLQSQSRGYYRERGSKFFATARAVQSENEVKNLLAEAAKEHPKARHHCYAFRLADGSVRAGDAREPRGSAGQPILQAILRHDLRDVAVVVSRYFGGKQLGLPVLAQAYRQAAEQALLAAAKTVAWPMEHFDIAVPYEQAHPLFTLLARFGAVPAGRSQGAVCTYDVAIKRAEAAALLAAIRSHPLLHACRIGKPAAGD
jgi:putative IMPACT (imprinted ancient) family translation regulator